MNGVENRDAHAVFQRETEHIGYLDTDAAHPPVGVERPHHCGGKTLQNRPFRFIRPAIGVEVPGQSSMASMYIDGTSRRARRTVQIAVHAMTAVMMPARRRTGRAE